MNALVDATPISGPARVSRLKSLSLISELSATLQIVKEPIIFSKELFLTEFNAARVSAVSPDCEIVTINVPGSTTG